MKKITLILVFCMSAIYGNAQSYMGYLTDNYSGVNSVISNPSNIVDSRFKTDINLVGVSLFTGNDYYGVKLLDAIEDEFDFDLDAIKSPSKDNNLVLNIDVLGPSFMFNLNRKSSIAIFTRARSIININGVNGNTIDAIDDSDTGDFVVDEGDFGAFGQAWAEVGLTYARVIKNDKEHFFKGGISLKYLQGAGSGSAYGRNVTIDYDEDGTDLGGGITTGSFNSTGQLTYGRFDDFDADDYDYELPEGNGFGVDLGFVYEWRPNHADYVKTNSKGDSYALKDVNKYKLKIGLSITDIGSINYKNGKSDTYDITNPAVSEDDFDSAEDVEEFLNNVYTLTKSSGAFKTKLPTALHINADWNFRKHLYVNLNTDLGLRKKGTMNTSHISNVVSLTPRFESKWLSFYVPLSVVQYNGFQAGAGLRMGPFYIGSGSVISALTSDNVKGADAYAGLKIPVYQRRPRDKDDDGVIDKLDACPKEAGPVENNGCPWGDKDGDSILDNVDECPEEVGPEENKGCPWGDKDGDSILDNVDKCPEEAGPEENKGCPWGDEDGDTVLDNVDECVSVFGAIENKGCPWGDQDGDTVLDNVDRCISVPGAIENSGCPWKDSDGDTVLDKDDNCIDEMGTVANNGCPEPEVTAVVQKKLNKFAETILFNSGKSSIKEESNKVLENIVAILQEYPSARFSIEGHTDSAGSSVSNQNLSESRAISVMTFLIENGLDSSRFESKGFGESKPKATNSTRVGRAKNRRVEINLIK